MHQWERIMTDIQVDDIKIIHTGFFKLDGGAMFGVVPKALWSRTNPPDDANRCTWSMRCLLVEKGDRKILIDTGIGDKQSDKFFRHYDLHGDLGVDQALNKHGLSSDQITDVFITHLHFDHVGGAVKMSEDGKLVPAFPNATYWSHKKHWEWAANPNPREKASFLKENFIPLAEANKVRFIDEGHDLPFEILLADGHTEKQMMPSFIFKGRQIVFMADLLPSVSHIPLPYVMSYDVRPLITMAEKTDFLKKAVERKLILFLEHDPLNECCTVQNTEKGVRLHEAGTLEELLN